MGPHPAFRESMTAQRVEALRGSAVAPKRAVRRRLGFVFLALGERRTPRVRPAARSASAYFSSRRSAAELMQ
jgi:hypothetical protein